MYIPIFEEVFEFIPVYKVVLDAVLGEKKPLNIEVLDAFDVPGILDVLDVPDDKIPFFPKKYSLAFIPPFMSLSTIIIWIQIYNYLFHMIFNHKKSYPQTYFCK